MLFAIIAGPTFEKAQADLNLIRGAQGVEIRLDLFDSIDPKKLEILIKLLKSQLSLKVLLALRPLREGGKFKGDEKERLQILYSLCQLEPDYIDLEWDVSKETWKSFTEAFPKIQKICSYHNFIHYQALLPLLKAS